MIWVWLWEIRSCESGNAEAIVARALATGVGVIVKVNDGELDRPNGVGAFDLLARLRQANVPARAWGYCYPQADPAVQADFARRSIGAGAERYIVDAEIEWEGFFAEASALVGQLPAGSGYSPLPIIDYHTQYPYTEFNRLGLALPQAYAGTGGYAAADAFNWSEANWRQWIWQWSRQGASVPAIEWAVYGADQSADDLRTALRLATDRSHVGTGDASIWSWQHLQPEHWTVIAEFVVTEESEDMETLQRVSNHLVAPYARQGSTLHLANPDGAPIPVSIIKDGAGTVAFAQNLQVAPYTHVGVPITVDAAPLFVEDQGSSLVATIEPPRR